MILGDLRKTIKYAGRNGLYDTFYAARERISGRLGARYVYEAPSEEEVQKQRMQWQQADQAALPKISFLVPMCEPNLNFMMQMITSVQQQTWHNCELVIADASADDLAAKMLSDLSDGDLIYKRLPFNGGISENTNAAAACATGDYVALLDYDDLLTPDCVYEVTKRIVKDKGHYPEILYSDEDKCDASARRFFEPNHKPDFNTEYFLSNNYICHLLVMKRELFLALKLRKEYDGAQDYDLMLRAPRSNICHIPKVLYHWRTHNGSTAGNPASKDYAYDAGRRALIEYFRTCHINADVVESRHRGFFNIIYHPDIFTARRDIGVTGGKIVNRRHRIVGGMMDADGHVIFKGMHMMESGPMHRADTMQDCMAVDVRCMRIREELKNLYKETFGHPYEEHIMSSRDDELIRKSLAFCRQVREMGYLIVWDPSMVHEER